MLICKKHRFTELLLKLPQDLGKFLQYYTTFKEVSSRKIISIRSNKSVYQANIVLILNSVERIFEVQSCMYIVFQLHESTENSLAFGGDDL